jgi:hypothetical protein
MKRSILRATYVIAFIVGSVYGGWWIGELTSSISFEMPLWLAYTIEAGMHLAGAPDPLDPEIIETFGLMLLWLAYSILVAIVLGIGLFLLRRYLKKRRAS